METPSKIMFIVERDELYSVQLKNPQLDAFIKSILRMYTGLFSKMTAIDIDYIAKVTMDTSFGVNEKLVLLKQKGIIKYAPKVRTPLLISNSERLTESNFYLSQKEYQSRKDMFGSRIEGVINYVKCEDICRSKLLLDYFSQPAADDCGICDVCISNKNNLEYKSRSMIVRDEIIKIVKEKKQIPVSAIESMAGDEYLFYLSVMRLMADNNELKIVDGVVSF
jgi:ATP-dependent DNA helicase RecQ